MASASGLDFESAGDFTDGSYEAPIQVAAASATWPHSGFESMVEAIANDEYRAIWVSQVSGEVFAPYDRGVDLIATEATGRRGALRSALGDWLSPRADEL
ncbi:MAG: hypothetical protein H0T89_16205 [Deltaproteobacteria bacterium]|nr:hypothetical protein [Deltaproteobacteria bacterium]MDQ3295265.1 hypothetical protein [Myxococcota bacterium]